MIRSYRESAARKVRRKAGVWPCETVIIIIIASLKHLAKLEGQTSHLHRLYISYTGIRQVGPAKA